MADVVVVEMVVSLGDDLFQAYPNSYPSNKLYDSDPPSHLLGASQAADCRLDKSESLPT